jgi:hypothetical protein
VKPRTPLQVEGRLALVDPQSRTITVAALGRTLAVGFPDAGSARSAYMRLAARGGGNRLLRTIQKELREADLALDFQVRGVSVARLAGDSQASLTGRALRTLLRR